MGLLLPLVVLWEPPDLALIETTAFFFIDLVGSFWWAY